jgi:hypothetical protein
VILRKWLDELAEHERKTVWFLVLPGVAEGFATVPVLPNSFPASLLKGYFSYQAYSDS